MGLGSRTALACDGVLDAKGNCRKLLALGPAYEWCGLWEGHVQ